MPGTSPTPDLLTTAAVEEVAANRWRVTERQSDPVVPGRLLGYLNQHADGYETFRGLAEPDPSHFATRIAALHYVAATDPGLADQRNAEGITWRR